MDPVGLKVLKLGNNEISNLDETISEFQELQELDVSLSSLSGLLPVTWTLSFDL
jgi:Leucine-rich repeat (LRR) protein